MERRERRELRKLSVIGLLVLLFATGACGGNASISNMVPGGNPLNGNLECWLTLEFAEPPGGVDPRDVEVVFTSIALQRPQAYGWDWIAKHDRKAESNGWNDATEPGAAPPPGSPFRIKFPLRAIPRLELGLGDTLELTAELYWGGVRQDAVTRSIEHVYARRL